MDRRGTRHQTMGSPKPITIDGQTFSSRSAAIRHFAANGLSNQQIARATGLDRDVVERLKHSALKGTSDRAVVYLPPDLATRLRAQADRRQTSYAQLAKAVLCAVIEDNLIDAVLERNDG